MSEEILVIRNKRPREENDTMEETGKIKKKRKMAEVDVCQNKHKAKVVSKVRCLLSLGLYAVIVALAMCFNL